MTLEYFPEELLHKNFKHVVYNLLAASHNGEDNLVSPCLLSIEGTTRQGFTFDPAECPEKRLPELYAFYVRNARLDMENQHSLLIQDLYQYYLTACLKLLGKYFEQVDTYTFLYHSVPLFLPSDSLPQAQKRIELIPLRSKKRASI